MRKILFLIATIPLIVSSTEYRVNHLKEGMQLNVRERPLVNSSTLIGKIPSNAIGIRVKECKYAKDGNGVLHILPYGVLNMLRGGVRALLI